MAATPVTVHACGQFDPASLPTGPPFSPNKSMKRYITSCQGGPVKSPGFQSPELFGCPNIHLILPRNRHQWLARTSKTQRLCILNGREFGKSPIKSYAVLTIAETGGGNFQMGKSICPAHCEIMQLRNYGFSRRFEKSPSRTLCRRLGTLNSRVRLKT
jgi:hypothetical protein